MLHYSWAFIFLASYYIYAYICTYKHYKNLLDYFQNSYIISPSYQQRCNNSFSISSPEPPAVTCLFCLSFGRYEEYGIIILIWISPKATTPIKHLGTGLFALLPECFVGKSLFMVFIHFLISDHSLIIFYILLDSA